MAHFGLSQVRVYYRAGWVEVSVMAITGGCDEKVRQLVIRFSTRLKPA